MIRLPSFSNLAYVGSGLLLIIAVFLLPSLVLSLAEADGQGMLFAVQIAVMLIVSFILRRLNSAPQEITIRDGFLIVTLGWLFMSLLGALPAFLSGWIPNFSDAVFESVSGFTTTGASILTDIERLPRSLLLWRSTTHWLGGMGVIALAVAIFPFLGASAYQLFRAEVPGPTSDRLSPRISGTAKYMWWVYVGLTVLQIILLLAGGMPLFDSVCTTFGTMATGGFSNRNASIAAYQSPYLQYVIIVFMFIAGASFTLHWLALRGKPGVYLKNDELRFFALVVVLATALIFAFRIATGTAAGEPAFRSTLFHVVSCMTSTGFVTEDYGLWPVFPQLMLLALMFFGGCTSSTGGGMKNIRILVFLRHIGAEFKKLVHPSGVFPVKVDKKPVPDPILNSILAFVAVYIILFVVGALVMGALGLRLDAAVSSVAACLGTVGPGIGTGAGSVGPAANYAHVPEAGKWVLAFLMLAGRLELYTVLVLFTRRFWR